MEDDTDDASSLPDPLPGSPPDVEWALYPKTRLRRRLRQLPIEDYDARQAAAQRRIVEARRQEGREVRGQFVYRRLELEMRARQPVNCELLSSYGLQAETLGTLAPLYNHDSPHVTKAALSRPKLDILMAHRHAELELLRSRHQLTEELEATVRTPYHSLSRRTQSSKPSRSATLTEPLPAIMAATPASAAARHRATEEDLEELHELNASFEERRFRCREDRQCGMARKPNMSLAVSTPELKAAAFARPLYLF